MSVELSEKNVVNFWRGVLVGDPDECWLWARSVDKKTGYGQYCIGRKGKSKGLLPHRVAHCLGNLKSRDLSKIKKLVLHSCDVKLCCNPRHLREGTHKQNWMEAVERGLLRYGTHTNRKLSSKQVRHILEKYNQGVSQAALGREYGISKSMVGAIVRREIYVL